MLKAAAGGGGKGMRVVRDAGALESAWGLTRGEAAAAFGDDRVYVERFVERPRHVEAQILADATGRVVFLGERECSVQRRHQKLFEESPSPAFTPDIRRRFAEAAVRIAKRVGYLNAGTVEFILDEDGSFYFLEVNTRLQVEHPVTEEVTGLDLVAEQVAIAEGAPLSFGDAPPEPRGWAMEARIVAENPRAGFMPSLGRIGRVRFPHGPGVRNDGGFYRGYDIPVYYDSLLTKLVTWGRDREQARRRMLRALDEFRIDGVHHNITFHRWLLAHPAFIEGRLSTRFIDEHFDPAALDPGPEAERAAVFAAALHAREERERATLPPADAAPARSHWRWDRPGGGGARR
jgi:acetyl-CoA carboxylase biotin carboxylase subunit